MGCRRQRIARHNKPNERRHVVTATILALLCNSANGLLVRPHTMPVRNDEAHRQQNSAMRSTIDPASITTTTTSSLDQLHSTNDVAFYAPASIRTTIPTKRSNHIWDALIVQPTVARFVPWQDEMYDKALHLKCPFLRRRAIDAVEFWHAVVRTVLDPNELHLGVCPSLLCHGRSCTKRFGLSLDELLTAIRADWKDDIGYYVTGKLSTDIYRDDCCFDGPDPDMPVVGLRKYMYAASQLFDAKQSWSKLSSIEIVNDNSIVAHWQFRGILRLPWKPLLPVVCGSTTYHVDPCGLICKHTETWDLSVQEAFLRTFLPALFPAAG